MDATMSPGPTQWNPEDASPHLTLFGLPPATDAARIHVLPVPWDATCSYGRGTSRGPEAVRRASLQLDLLDPMLGDVWRQGIHMHGVDPELLAWSLEASSMAKRLRQAGLETVAGSDDFGRIDRLSAQRSARVQEWTTTMLEQDRVPAILGGDHSSPLGAIRAAAERGPLSILHFDAHLDQREAYEGFAESHASVFYNVLEQCPQVVQLVSVGIRDFSAGEWTRVEAQADRVRAMPLARWQASLFAGTTFDVLCRDALDGLGERVWISFDIDALAPDLCPHTGTPVPGGMSFEQASHLLHLLADSERNVVGFDLCEVWGPDEDQLSSCSAGELPQLEWDANVGARILYKLCGTVT